MLHQWYNNVMLMYASVKSHSNEVYYTRTNTVASNSATAYTSGAQRPARGPHPARDESSCGPPLPKGENPYFTVGTFFKSAIAYSSNFTTTARSLPEKQIRQT